VSLVTLVTLIPKALVTYANGILAASSSIRELAGVVFVKNFKL